jgi:hypothetical protein
MQHPAARVKELKDSVWILRDAQTQQPIAFADEHREPRLAPLHLATMAEDTPEALDAFTQLASRRLAGRCYELERIDAVHTSARSGA